MRYSIFGLLILSFFFVSCTQTQVVAKKSVDTINQGLITKIIPLLSLSDQKKALKTEYQALENEKINQPFYWHSLFQTTHGVVRVNQIYQVGKEICRHYTHKVTIKKHLYEFEGNACRNADENWSVFQ